VFVRLYITVKWQILWIKNDGETPFWRQADYGDYGMIGDDGKHKQDTS